MSTTTPATTTTTTTGRQDSTMTTSTQQPTSILKLYWDIASKDATARLKATSLLLRSLAVFQTTWAAEKKDGGQVTPEKINEDEEDEELSVKSIHGTTAALNALCAPDVTYAIRRLIRGLGSSRECARLGFSVALTQLLVILKDVLNCSLVVDLIFELTDLSNTSSPQELKDIQFGRIFGFMSLVESGLLLSAAANVQSSSVKRVVESLVQLSDAKSYLKEVSYHVLVRFFHQISSLSASVEHLSTEEIVPWMVSKVLNAGVNTPEDVYFVIEVYASGLVSTTYDWATLLPSWKYGNVLHPKNKAQLVSILKDASASNPRLHCVWDSLLNTMTPSGSAIKSMKTVTLPDLWCELNEILFTSTMERKYMGLLLFQTLLPQLTQETFSFIFTPALMRCLMINLSNKGSVLYKLSRQTTAALSTLTHERPEFAFPVILQLTGKHGHAQFDNHTNTTTIQDILTKMTSEGITGYVEHLMMVFFDKSQIPLEGEGPEAVEMQTQAIQNHRIWAVDQMSLLIRNQKIPKDEAWMRRIVQLLCCVGFFDVCGGAETVTALGWPVATPALNKVTTDACRERFFNVLGSLIGVTVPSAKTAGTMADGKLWTAFVYEYLNSIQLELLQPLSADAAGALQDAKKNLGKIASSLARFETSSKTRDPALIAQYRAFELLFSLLVLQLHEEEDEAIPLLKEVDTCFKNWKKSLSSDKGHDAQDVSDEIAPVEVIVDILISFMARSSSLLRSVSCEIFKAFSSHMTKPALDLIFSILTAKSGMEGAKELFQDNEDDMEVDDNTAAESESNSEDDESDDDETTATEKDLTAEDELLKRKIQEALQASGAVADGDEDDVENQLLDDDEMTQFDDKLAEIFRQRKDLKSAKKNTKQQVLHFKFRVLELLEIFVKKEPQSPLMVSLFGTMLDVLMSTSKSDDDIDLHKKLTTIIRNKLCALKSVPQVDNVEEAFEILGRIHDCIRKAVNGILTSTLSLMSVQLVKIIQNSSSIEPSRKKLNAKDGDSIYVASPQERIVEIYMSTLTDFMNRGKSRVKANVFTDLIDRQFILALILLPKLAAFSGVRAYPLTQTIGLVSSLLKKAPKADDEEVKSKILASLPSFYKSLAETLLKAPEHTQGPFVINKERMRELIKSSVTVTRLAKKMISSEKMHVVLAEVDLLTPLTAMKEAANQKALKSQISEFISLL